VALQSGGNTLWRQADVAADAESRNASGASESVDRAVVSEPSQAWHLVTTASPVPRNRLPMEIIMREF